MKGTLKSSEKINELFSTGSVYKSAGFLALYRLSTGRNVITKKRASLSFTYKEKGCRAVQVGKMAFIAGKKLGNAPLRNRAKRRLREAAHLVDGPWDHYDVVLLAKRGAVTQDFATLVSELGRLSVYLENKKENKAAKENKSLRTEEAQFCKEKKAAVAQKEKEEGKEKGFLSHKQKHRSVFISFIVAIPRRIALLCIKVYRHAISPLLPPSCRYVPTCSEYARIAFERFGFWRGLLLSAKRIGRCHPFARGGYDPVPKI